MSETTAPGERQARYVPSWLVEVARPTASPVPWGAMGHAAIAIGAPVIAGVAAAQIVHGVLASLGGSSAVWLTGPDSIEGEFGGSDGRPSPAAWVEC
jgi:hypothetical protein